MPRAARAIAAALLLSACGSGAGPSTVTTEPAGAADPECAFSGAPHEFDGFALVEVAYRDVFGTTYERSYTRTDAGIEVGPPVVDAGGNEPNRVHLSFGTETQDTEGSFLGISSVPFVDPQDGRHATFNYWSLSASCDALTGTLADSHADAGIGFVNGVMAQKDLGAGLGFTTWPFSMATGATLEATATATGVHLVVRGRDVEGVLEFTITIDAA